MCVYPLSWSDRKCGVFQGQWSLGFSFTIYWQHRRDSTQVSNRVMPKDFCCSLKNVTFCFRQGYQAGLFGLPRPHQDVFSAECHCPPNCSRFWSFLFLLPHRISPGGHRLHPPPHGTGTGGGGASTGPRPTGESLVPLFRSRVRYTEVLPCVFHLQEEVTPASLPVLLKRTLTTPLVLWCDESPTSELSETFSQVLSQQNSDGHSKLSFAWLNRQAGKRGVEFSVLISH